MKKLTLSIPEEIITQAKSYAKKKGKSLSSIIAEFLSSLDNSKVANNKSSTPISDSLLGLAKLGEKDSQKTNKQLLEEARNERLKKYQ